VFKIGLEFNLQFLIKTPVGLNMPNGKDLNSISPPRLPPLTANEVLEACNVVRMVVEYLVSLPFSLRQSFFSRRWLCSSVASLMCPSFAKTCCQLTSWISELRRVGIDPGYLGSRHVTFLSPEKKV